MPSADVIWRCCKGEFYKWLFALRLLRPHGNPLNTTESRDRKLVVSLTSYGRRVAAVAPYAIMSMMRQTVRPDAIILWLDDDNWSSSNLPESIVKLQKKGLTVKFCKDTKSYKKLLPALAEYPDDLIFTIDDDIYYPSDMLAKVMKAYEADNNKIYCVRGYTLAFDELGKLKPYNDWPPILTGQTGKCIFPTGGAGCLYQKRLLHSDITDDVLCRELAPHADDIWFFFMEFLAGTPIEILSICNRNTISIDSFYQHFHAGSNLSAINCGESKNDTQFRNLMNHYGLTDNNFLRETTNDKLNK